MVKKYGDLYSGLFLLLLSVVMYFASFSIKMLTVSVVGSAFFPKLTAAGIFLVSLVILTNGIKQGKAAKKEETVTEAAETEEDKPNYSAVAISLVLMVGYLAFMEFVGFLIMTTIYLILQIYVLADSIDRKWPLFILVSVITSGATYFLFRSVFHVMLPPGILG